MKLLSQVSQGERFVVLLYDGKNSSDFLSMFFGLGSYSEIVFLVTDK